MATNVTHLAVINDGEIRLTPGGDIDVDLPFTLPDNTANRRGVLIYMTDAQSPNNLAYTMALNGAVELRRTVDSTVHHTEHEIVSQFRAGQNTLRIQVTAGTGVLILSDIVLYYDRGI
jgi:hypothetical protein